MPFASIFWIHWKNTYSVMTGVVGLAKDGDYVLAAVIFFFSIVFPIGKLAALLLGKWSMLDVFVVAIFLSMITTMLVDQLARRSIKISG